MEQINNSRTPSSLDYTLELEEGNRMHSELQDLIKRIKEEINSEQTPQQLQRDLVLLSYDLQPF